MSQCIRFSWPSGKADAILADTPTAVALLNALPIEGDANIWGEEVYFDAGFSAAVEPDAREVVNSGDVCYWVQGQCLALLYGPTPASREGECRLISKANVIGKIKGNPHVLETVCNGDFILVEVVE